MGILRLLIHVASLRVGDCTSPALCRIGEVSSLSTQVTAYRVSGVPPVSNM